MKTHAGEKSYKYEQCDFASLKAENLRKWLITYEKPLIHFGTDILKIVSVLVLSDTSYFC